LPSLFLLATLLAFAGRPPEAGATPSDGTPAEQLFARHCSVCHGAEGAGDGTEAARLRTQPADLTDGRVKFRTTPWGTPPRVADVERTIRDGARGTAMVQWRSELDDEQIRSLALWVLAREGFTGRATEPLPPTAAAGLPADPAEAYLRLGCNKCHGDDRAGDGPSARDLVDAKGRALPATDLRQLPYKRGDRREDTAATLLWGLEGTAMPAYANVLDQRRALDLAAWLHDQAVASGEGWLGEEHLGFMIEMHSGGRSHGPGMGMGRGGRGRGGMGMRRHRRGS
jgi:mono/diheme cytochrome c family protein